jgi:hypothetical protein
MIIVTIAFLINVVVAGAVGTLLSLNHPRTTAVYGERTPARAILSSIYLAIAVLSLAALFLPTEQQLLLALGLFPMQILYKLTTPFTVKSLQHPVVLSNLLIALVLAAAVIFILTN